MDRLQGTKLDWYVKDTHIMKESTLKRHFLHVNWLPTSCNLNKDDNSKYTN
jgi:hypothetical protein